jgi:hypothetical protein
MALGLAVVVAAPIATPVTAAMATSIAPAIAAAVTAPIPVAVLGEGRLFDIEGRQSDRRDRGDQERGQKSSDGRTHVVLLVWFRVDTATVATVA